VGISGSPMTSDDSVLVLDANCRQSLAVARSLGRAGIEVGLAESSDAYQRPIPAFSSSYVSSTVALPSLCTTPNSYASELLHLLHCRPVRVVIPSLDASIAALRPWRDRIEKETTLALAAESALSVANDKARTLLLADELGIKTPSSKVVNDPAQMAAVLAAVGLPAVIKPNGSWLRGPSLAVRLTAQDVPDIREGERICHEMLDAGAESVVIQEWIPGRREAVCFFYAHGRMWAEFALVVHRTNPPLGGNSVVRESVAMTPDLREAGRLVEALELEGFSEVEFRRDARGQLVLMEINARLSANIELPIRAGIDFPRYIWNWATGMPLHPASGYRSGVRLRYLYGDVRWLVENLKHQNRPDNVPLARAVGAFSSEFFRADRFDIADSGDPKPALAAATRSILGGGRRVCAKLRSVALPQTASRHVERGSSASDTIVIGSGPYGLSLAAHLGALGIDYRIFGVQMGAWKHNMPEGMILKSEPYATDLCAPIPGYTTADHARFANEPYRRRVTPLTRERFISYGEWFADRLVARSEDGQVAHITHADGGFVATTDAGAEFFARRIVLATGIVPFAHVPEQLLHLDGGLVTHSSRHVDLSCFSRADVVVVGGGQSALETSALLLEAGARPRLLVRGPAICWPTANPERVSLLYALKRPPARLCEGWKCLGYDQLPDLFRFLPRGERAERARTFLGPAGAWWLRSRVEGSVPMHVGMEVLSAKEADGRVKLDLFGPGPSEIECDHVIAATGYRYDVKRLTFLDRSLRDQLRTWSGAPVVSRRFESSISNLYFMGAITDPAWAR